MSTFESMRSMTNEEAIHSFESRMPGCAMPGTRKLFEMAISALRATQWISVKDRLPDKLEPVNIVWVNRKPERYYAGIKDKAFVATGYYWDNKWWWFSATCEDYLAEYGHSDVDEVDKDIEITHWMPLPEPPEENEQ